MKMRALLTYRKIGGIVIDYSPEQMLGEHLLQQQASVNKQKINLWSLFELKILYPSVYYHFVGNLAMSAGVVS